MATGLALAPRATGCPGSVPALSPHCPRTVPRHGGVCPPLINHVPSHSCADTTASMAEPPKEIRSCPLFPLSPHKSFLKRAISSYLYTLIICVKSSYLKHLHCWLAPPPRLSQLSPGSPAICSYLYMKMPGDGQLSLLYFTRHPTLWDSMLERFCNSNNCDNLYLF